MFSEIPVVYAVGTEYQILFHVSRSAYAWIKIGDLVIEDAVCGNLRSAPGMRRITIPQSVLHAVGGYTLCLEYIRERKSYWTETLETQERFYAFYPVPETGEVRACMLGDAHGDSRSALEAAAACGAFDFLILNGDINESTEVGSFELAHNLAAQLTGGSRPVVYARGNHENRGAAAELLPGFVPTRNGETYYTFRLGGIWGVVLDCGEDKVDSHPEYGGSARFHAFRVAQTAYLRRVIDEAQTEFDAPGVTHRIAVVHTQFPRKQEPDFDIERELFQTWCDLLKAMRTQVILSAHMHRFQLLRPGDPDLRLRIPCPLVIGTAKNNAYLGATAIRFLEGETQLRFVTSQNEILQQETI